MEEPIIEEESEKQKYINENIIDKGYNPEDLSAFIVNRRAGSIEEISLELLKKEIEAFKNMLLEDAYTTVKKTMAITKKDEQINDLYSSQTIKVDYSRTTESVLMKLEKEGKKIKVKISNGKFEKVGGIFSSQIKYVCNLTCDELQSNVKRTIDDLEWLKDKLNENYPLIYVPPIYTKDKNKNEKPHQQTRFITKFMNAVLRKKLLRLSPIIYQFLTLDTKPFAKYKDALNKKKFSLNLKMDNFKSLKESDEIQFSKEQIYLPEKYLEKINLSEYNSLLDNLNKLFLEMAYDFKNLGTHSKDLSETFFKLYSHATKADENENIRSMFSKFRTALNHWSESFNKQSLFFGLECKEFFTYINYELNELNNIYSQYTKYKDDYEKMGIQLYEKKVKLFEEKQYDKWELSKEDEKKIDEFKNNFNEASKYMCKDFSEIVAGQKIRVACSCNIILKEFKKVDKYLGEQLITIYDSFKVLNETVMKEKFVDFKTLHKI